MTELRIHLFGSPRLERDGVTPALGSRKVWALLAYLVVTGTVHRRDALALLFWPDAARGQSRANLRNLLWLLNKGLGDGWLRMDQESVALPARAGLWVDVGEFDGAVRAAKQAQAAADLLAEAVRLYTADFLEGFTLAASEAWDEWQLFQTESLRRQLAEALKQLVRHFTARAEWEAAIPYALRWLSMDSLHEAAHRHLMQLYAWSGERAAALRQYQTCVSLLDEELGVPPLEETTALYERILSGEVGPRLAPESSGGDPAPPAGDAPAAGPRAEPPGSPFVGRAAEWQRLQSCYRAVKSGGQLVVLEGEAGIGKTRLAEELLALARGQGATVLTARAYNDESSLTYGLQIGALSAALSDGEAVERLKFLPPHALSELCRLLPRLVTSFPALPPAPPLDSPGARSRFLESIVDALDLLTRGSLPGILFFDDLHFADTASLDSLAYLARRLEGHPLLLVMAWRSEQVEAGNRLRQIVSEAQRAGRATQLQLTRLDSDAIHAWVGALTGVGLSTERLAERLFQETDGLPYFVAEYLNAFTGGAIEPSAAAWTLPGGVRDLLQARVTAVGGAARQLLTSAAAIGRPVEFDLLAQISGRSEEEAVAALELLQEAWLLVESGSTEGATYDFSHEKLRQLVYEETGTPRRRLLHRRIAEALIQQARGQARLDAAAGQIAFHYRQAGQVEAAADYYRRAGTYARSLYANADALSHFEAALALGHPERFDLQLSIGEMQTLLGAYRDAIASFQAAAAGRATREGRTMAMHRLGQVYARRGEWALAAQQMAAAMEESGGEDARILIDWSLALSRLGDLAKARAVATRALRMSHKAAETYQEAQARNTLGLISRAEGNLEAARDEFERSLALLEQTNDPARVAALNNLALVAGARGDGARAIELARLALELVTAQGDRHREAALHSNLADLLYAAGQRAPAMEHLTQSARIYADIGRDADEWQPEIWKLSEW